MLLDFQRCKALIVHNQALIRDARDWRVARSLEEHLAGTVRPSFSALHLGRGGRGSRASFMANRLKELFSAVGRFWVARGALRIEIVLCMLH